MKVHNKKTKEIEFIYKKKDFKRIGLKKSFRFNTNFKILNKKALSVSGDKHVYIKGYASTADQDRTDDIITLSALEKSKDHLLQQGSRTVFYNHNKSMPIGRVMNTAVDEKGLICEIQISNAKDCKDIRTKIKEKVLNSLSIGGRFNKVQVERDDSGEVIAFKILDLDLFEVSVVGLPCNAKASIFNVIEKSFKGANTKGKTMKTRKEIKKSKKNKAQPTDGAISNSDGSTPKVGPKMPVTPSGMPSDHAKHIADVATAINDHVVKNYFEPMQKSLDTVASAISKMDEHMKSNYSATKSEKTEKVEKKKKILPSWARKIVKRMKSISKNFAEAGGQRKGATSEEKMDEDEENEETDNTPKKVIRDVTDQATVKFVKHAMENLDVYEGLKKSEKEKVDKIYFSLLDHGTRQERR